jgi:hypothetical protein
MPVTSPASSTGGVLQNAEVSFPGQVLDLVQAADYNNAAVDTKQVVTVTIGTATTGNYTVTALGQTATFVRAAENAAAIAAGLAAALSGGAISGRFTISSTATTVVLTNKISGDVTPVSGTGGTGYGVASVAPTIAANIGFGLVIAKGGSVVEGLQTCKLPDASGNALAGVSMADKSVLAIGGFGQNSTVHQSGAIVGVLEDGKVCLVAEAAISITDTLYFRHTADGAFTRLGAVAGASGTGLATLASVGATATPLAPSFASTVSPTGLAVLAKVRF